jgi:hypothetical protein
MPKGLKTNWEFVSDTVMGGVSQGRISHEVIAGREATRLSGEVSLENNGGFVQMAFDVDKSGSDYDASEFKGIELHVFGNDETYDLRLRTSDLTRPWQSFRASFLSPSKWTTVYFSFENFIPHKTGALFNPKHLSRIGVLGIGKAFSANVAVSAIRLINQ